MINNLILDINNKIKIPQNNTFFFNISRSKDWKNTIDLIIKIKEDINYLNLYIIIKSYLSSIIYPFVEITIRIKKKNDIIITERINSSVIMKMNYYEFQKWAQYRINYDLKYYGENSFYSFSFISNTYIVKTNDLLYIKPLYPWKEKILVEIKSIENRDIIYEEIIKKKKKEIIILKRKIYYFKKFRKLITH